MTKDVTKILDVITPEVYNSYMQQYTAEKSLIVTSGIAIADERVSRMITAGNTLVNMPFWNDLSGDDEVLGDGVELGTGKITAGKDVAAVMYRGRGWAVSELSAVVSGDDPMRALLSRIGDYWLRQEQKVLLSVLKGLFAPGGALAGSHLLNIASKPITAKQVLNAKQLLGDAADKIKVIVMHSAVYTKLQQDNLIVYVQPTKADVNIPTYLGYRVIVDDSNAPAGDEYTTYLLAEGAFGRNAGTPTNLTTFETNRVAAKGIDEVYTRRAFVFHPYGVKFTDTTVSGETPSNAELATANNWAKVYEDKNIGIVAIRHKLGADAV